VLVVQKAGSVVGTGARRPVYFLLAPRRFVFFGELLIKPEVYEDTWMPLWTRWICSQENSTRR